MYALQQGLSMMVFLKKKVINFFWLMYALQRGIFIIFGRICMPFSKVLLYLYSSVYPLIRYYNLWTHMYARQQVISISSLLLTYELLNQKLHNDLFSLE